MSAYFDVKSIKTFSRKKIRQVFLEENIRKLFTGQSQQRGP
jgi:hypothetical protein